MRPLPTIARDLEASSIRYDKAQRTYCTDAEFARISDKHWELLAEFNAAAKAAGKPQAHQLDKPAWAALLAEAAPATEAERLALIAANVQTIFKCQGWREALADTDPGNLTVWLGPPLSHILDLAEGRKP